MCRIKFFLIVACLVIISNAVTAEQKQNLADRLESLLAKRAMNGAIAFKEDIDKDGNDELILANKYLILVFNPNRGGIAEYCIYRPKSINLTGQYGLFEDDIWQLSHDEQEFKKGIYEYKIEKSKSEAAIVLWRKETRGIYQYLTITKRISVDSNTPRIRADYKIHNDPDSVGAMDVGLWFHHQIGTNGGNRYFVPTREGVEIAVQGQRSPQDWWHNPSRGWRAVVGRGEIGVAAVMDYRYLKNFYNWYGKLAIPTFEWRFHNVTLQQDETFETTFYFVFFEGLNRVDEAKKEFVAAFYVPGYAKPKSQMKLRADIVSVDGKDIECVLKSRILPSKNLAVIAKKVCKFNSPVDRCKFSVTRKFSQVGTYVFGLSFARNNRQIGYAERSAILGRSSGEYEMKPIEPNFGGAEEGKQVRVSLANLMSYSEKFITPHIEWEKPSANGKIKALILVPASGAREIAELSERFDIDYKTIFINQSAPWTHGDYFYVDIDPKIRKGIKKLLSDNKFDVIVLGGVFWKQYFQGSAEKLLLEQVKKGAGLVYIAPHSLTKSIADVLPVVVDGNSQYRTKSEFVSKKCLHPVTDGLDLRLLGRMNAMYFKAKDSGRVLLTVKNRPWLTVGRYGKGRVVAFTYRVTGFGHGKEVGGKLTPRIWDYDFGAMGPASKWNYHYWEYSLSLIGKAIRWAAKHEPKIVIGNVVAKAKERNVWLEIELNNKNNSKVSINLEITMFDCLSNILGKMSVNLITRTGKGKYSVSLPESIKPRAGRNVIHIIVKDKEGKIYDFGTRCFEYRSPVFIDRVSIDKRIVNKNEKVSGIISLSGGGKLAKGVLVVELYDAYKRLIDVQRFDGIVSSRAVLFLLRAANAMEVQGWVQAKLLEDGRIIDIKRAAVKYKLTSEERKWDDFKVKSYTGMWSLGMPAYLYPYYYGRLREIGFSEFECRPNNQQEAELTSQQGCRILASGVAGMKEPNAIKKYKLYLATKNKKYLVREKDLCSSKYLEKAHRFIHKLIKPALQYSCDYMMYDEDAYSGYGMDFNFSKASLKAFRKWLKGRYVSLEELNKEWVTSFKKWDDVVPMTLIEIRERQKKIPYNVAPWAEHRKFNEVTVLRTWKLYKQWIRELDPFARIGQSGTRPSGVYGGNDWARLGRVMDFIELYSNYGNQGKYVHCLTNSYITPWSAGYTIRDEALMWNNAIREGKGGICAYRAISMVRPDLSNFYITAKVLKKFASVAQSGIGKLIHGNSVEYKGDVAIHFSTNCIRSAWALGQDLDKIRDSYCKLLENMGYQYFYLSDFAIVEGRLTPKRFKMLILPYSVALSSAEVKAIRQYVKEGGVVFADLHPGLMNEHCSPLAQSSLEDVFGVKLRSLKRGKGDRMIAWGGLKFRPNLSGTLGLQKVRVKRFGKGYAVYADAIIVPVYESLRNKSYIKACALKADAIERGMKKILKLSGAVSPVELNIGVGYSHPHIGISEYSDGVNRYLVVVDSKFPRENKVILHWRTIKENLFVYDVTKGECLGRGNEAKLILNDIGNVFAAIPYKVSALKIVCGDIAVAGEKFGGHVEIEADVSANARCGRHVIRMEVYEPSGKLRYEYTKNLEANSGKIQFVIPFAYNDEKGNWRVCFCDVISGVKRSISVNLVGKRVGGQSSGADNVSTKRLQKQSAIQNSQFSIYLQAPASDSISVCWYQLTKAKRVYVEYGETMKLSYRQEGTLEFSEKLSPFYYCADVNNLKPETDYYYRIVSDNISSKIYHFRTLPARGSASKDGHIRFVIYGDSRTYPDRHRAIIGAMKSQLEQKYGKPISRFIDVIINVGDIVGDGRKYHQYYKYYFNCVSELSHSIPFMVVIGNHEREAKYFYRHMKYEKFAGPEGEKYYSFAIGRVLFIVMNTEIMGEKQFRWVEKTVKSAQIDNNIDWVICLSHYPVYSEEWYHKYSYRAWLTERVVPMLEKYSKVALMAYGHTHAYERGVLKDARIFLLMSGCGGAEPGNWKHNAKLGKVHDYPEIVKSITEFGYSIVDIDIKNRKMSVVSYAYGNGSKLKAGRIIDKFELDNSDISVPKQPKILSTDKNSKGDLIIRISPYKGKRRVEYAELELVGLSKSESKVLLDILQSRVNIYDVDKHGVPINHRAGKKISEFAIKVRDIPRVSFAIRARYRDSNLRWSKWSKEFRMK